HKGDTVLFGGTVYVYDGTDGLSVDLGAQTYTTPTWKTGRWVYLTKCDTIRVASTGLSYKYMGTDGLVDIDEAPGCPTPPPNSRQCYPSGGTDTATWAYAPPELHVVKSGEAWQLVSGTDVFLISLVSSKLMVSRPTIDAVAVAAAASVAVGGEAGVAIAGAGS